MAGRGKAHGAQFLGAGEDTVAGRYEMDGKPLLRQASRTGKADAVDGTRTGDDRGLALHGRLLNNQR